MMLARDIAGWALLLGGCFFLIVGAVGLIRLPDVYARIHSAGVIDTVGASFVLIGLAFYGGLTIVTLKLLLILVFIFITSPTATNALANAMYSDGVKPLLADEPEEPSSRNS
jgi:multicomponent Na+:H+ antiporter subunit G